MDELREDLKKELADVLVDKSTAMFVVDGKLFSLEVHDTPLSDEETNDLAQEIDLYPELRDSLQRFLDNPGMKSYTAKELKELRHENRE